MELTVDLLKPKIEVYVKHEGEQLPFPANVFSRDPFEKGYNPFAEINEYWKRLPLNEQDEIYDVFKNVFLAFETVLNADELFKELNLLIGRLFELHPLDKLESFLRLSPSIVVPDKVKATLPDPTDNTKTLGKTYTVRDYYPLLALAMFMRCLVPIWGEYVASIRRSSGVDRKEYNAMKLLDGTGIMETEAMQRLRVYVMELTSSQDDVDWERVLAGFSTDDIEFLMISLVCVRKLCLVDLRGSDPTTQAVAAIWKFLMHRVGSSSDSSVKIKENMRDTEAPGGRDQHSNIEAYRRRGEITLADVAAMENQLSRGWAIATYLETDIPEPLFEESMASAQNIEIENIGDPQMLIAGWLIKDIVTPHAPYYVSDENRITLAALEAVLWHRGFKEIAAIITSYGVEGTDEVLVGYSGVREQLAPALIEELKIYFPYEWGNSRRKGTPVQHDVIATIDHVADMLLHNSWRMSMADTKIRQLYGERRRKLVIPSDIKSQLARVIIDNEKRREYAHEHVRIRKHLP